MEDAENYEDLRLRATLDRRVMAGSFKWLLCVPMLAAGEFSEAFKNAVQDARRSRLSRPFIAPNPNRVKSTFPHRVHHHRCAVSPLTRLTVATPCLCRRRLPDRLSA